MRRIGIALLALALTAPGLLSAQTRVAGIPDTTHAAPGSAAAANSLAFRNGGTFWNPTQPVRPHNFPRHPHSGYWGSAYYGGFLPYAYAYPYSYPYDPSGYTAYAPGTFDNLPYPGYPYPAGYAPYPTNGYAPAAQSYASATSSSAPSAPASPPAPAAQQQSAAPSAGGVTTVNGSGEKSDPTVLVFRDGHRQQVDNYAIMGSTLFVLSGERTRIALAELDVPATMRLNEERGVEFHVPQK